MMQPRSLVWAAAAAVSLALASGCAVQPPRSAGVAPAERPVASAFELEGRLSASEGERGASGRLAWKHTPRIDEWTVFNPLGQIAAQLVSTPAGAELRSANGRRLEAASAAALLPELVGVPVPLDGLSHWVQADARPGARVLAMDELGRPLRISDAGWLIDYREYSTPAPEAPPRRIDAQWGDARLRLVIDQWTPLP